MSHRSHHWHERVFLWIMGVIVNMDWLLCLIRIAFSKSYYVKILTCCRSSLSRQRSESSSRGMKTRESCLLIVFASILQIIGIAIFAKGFLPYKKVLPGFAAPSVPADLRELGLEPVEFPERIFDRLIFIVIDALRRYIDSFRAWYKWLYVLERVCNELCSKVLPFW